MRSSFILSHLAAMFVCCQRPLGTQVTAQQTLMEETCRRQPSCDQTRQTLDSILKSVYLLQQENSMLRRDLQAMQNSIVGSVGQSTGTGSHISESHLSVNNGTSSRSGENTGSRSFQEVESPSLSVILEMLSEMREQFKTDIQTLQTKVTDVQNILRHENAENKQMLNSTKDEVVRLSHTVEEQTRFIQDGIAEVAADQIENTRRLMKTFVANVTENVQQGLSHLACQTRVKGLNGEDGPGVRDSQEGLTDTPGTTVHRDCTDVWNSGERQNGTYVIQPLNVTYAFRIYCEMTSEGAWNVIQRRQDGSVDFYRNWDEYRNGFGALDGEFWLGNEKIHLLTTQGAYNLTIEIWDWQDTRYISEADSFYVDDEHSKYSLHVPTDYYSYSGFGGSGLRVHNGPFCTFDRNTLIGRENCAEKFHCGWWFTSCVVNANLNGRYYHGGFADSDRGIRTRDDIFWPNVNQSLKKVFIKVQRIESKSTGSV